MKELLPGLRQFGTKPPDGSCGAIYLVGDESELALVDCGTAGNYPLLKQELAAEGLRPQDISTVYITHGHGDHHEGGVLLREESDAEIYVGKADRKAVETGDYWGTAGFYYGRHTLPLPETMSIGNGYERRIGGVLLRALETPGHTMGSITYELEIPDADATVALMGDTAWGGWHDRTGSDLEAWKLSVELLIGRDYTSLSFGHCVNKLVPAPLHLQRLQQEIGCYHNAYDSIPPHYFNEAIALPAWTFTEEVA
jgi:hydroxyacylglutathione hydrolase